MMHEQRGRARGLLAAAVLLASVTALRAEEKFSAGEMRSNCETILNAAKGTKNEDELELENTFAAGTCWGAFLSVQQFMVTKVEGERTAILKVCVPAQATLLQIIQVFDLFVRSNPKRQDEPFTKVAIAALRSAYPCK